MAGTPGLGDDCCVWRVRANLKRCLPISRTTKQAANTHPTLLYLLQLGYRRLSKDRQLFRAGLIGDRLSIALSRHALRHLFFGYGGKVGDFDVLMFLVTCRRLGHCCGRWALLQCMLCRVVSAVSYGIISFNICACCVVPNASPAGHLGTNRAGWMHRGPELVFLIDGRCPVRPDGQEYASESRTRTCWFCTFGSRPMKSRRLGASP